MTLNENHRRAILAAFRTIDKLLEDVENAQASAASPFSRIFNDLTPTQQQVIGDYVAGIRARMTDALKALATSVRPPGTAASWAIQTALAFAQITVQEIAPSRLKGYGPLDEEASTLIERLNADLERSIRRLDTYLTAGLGKDLAARLERLEAAPGDLDLLRKLERNIRERGLIEYHGALQSLLERLESKTFEIALFGKVSSGKSSLLNSVLGFDALPVGVTPVTAVPTRITWGDSPGARIRFADAPDEEISIERLAEFISETQNPENSKRVVRALVRLPSPRLRSGVVFVDTPGIGSLARAGARESYAYLPRCDLGVLLLDAATSPAREDLDILRLLYESGIPGMVVLSKSDLLSQADRTRMLDYVKGQIAKNLGLDLPVHAVSVVGTGAPLAHAWFAREIAPLCERAAELAEASGRRKLAALREGVTASLNTLLRERPETAAAGASQERAEVERLALEAEGSIQETTRRCEDLLSETKDLARPTLELAAREIARRMSAGEEPSSANATVRQAITDTVASVRAKIQEDLLATRGRLRDALAEMARRLSIPVKPEELGIELITQPTIAVPPEVDRADIRPAAWLSRLVSLSETRVRRRLLAQLEEPLDGAYASFSSQLRRWLTAALAGLASQFAAQAEPLRAHARRAAEGAGSGDLAGIAADLAEIEGSPEAVAPSPSGSVGRMSG